MPLLFRLTVVGNWLQIFGLRSIAHADGVGEDVMIGEEGFPKYLFSRRNTNTGISWGAIKAAARITASRLAISQEVRVILDIFFGEMIITSVASHDFRQSIIVIRVLNASWASDRNTTNQILRFSNGHPATINGL